MTPAQAGAQLARLRREGFKHLLAEFLDNTNGGMHDGLSWVMQLGSAAAARAELAAEIRDAKAAGQAPATFPVKTIPGAFGYGGASGGNSGGENILFADGPFSTWSATPGRGQRQTRTARP